MLIVVSGASAAGKSAVLPGLATRLSTVSWHEFDSVGVPTGADTAWRQRTLQDWVTRAVDEQARGRATGLCGQVAYGEVLACPAANALRGIGFCLLDCDDVVRIRRLRDRGSSVDQDTLSWAAWLRVHAADPTWRPDVITAGGAAGFRWERWLGWGEGDERWDVHRIDTTHLSIEHVVDHLVPWVTCQLDNPANPIAKSP